MGDLNGILSQVGGNLNNNFKKSQMPKWLPGGVGGWGGMLKLQFDRYITSKICSDLLISYLKLINLFKL